MYSERPVIKLTVSRLDRALDLIAIIILISTWVYTATQYSKLPGIIPTHFNLDGKIDDHGNKSLLFLLPAIITIVFTGMTILNKYPHIFNYMQKITTENAEQEYTAATRLMRIIKLIITTFCFIIMIDIIDSAKSGYSKLQWWIIPVFMISMFLPVIISLTVLKPKKK